MPKAYLTIDDSPSERTDDLVDFLLERKVPALLFISGKYMDANPAPIIRAIEKGFLIGNHGYDHEPAGDISFDQWREDFEKVEAQIEAAYESAGKTRNIKTYRFPYIDRGDGVRVERAAASGEGDAITDTPEVRRIQQYLKQRGIVQPFVGAPKAYPSNAADSLFTFTSGDWMLTARHKGKWEYKTLDDLKARIDAHQPQGNEVLLMHDQAEIFDVFCALVDYLLEKDFEFLKC
jgi:peptidoglycan/xylan/chitin deacetylase (PgdA/CDA1 family)